MTYDGSIKIDTKLDTAGAESGINKLKSVAKTGAVAVGAAVAAGLGAATKAGMDFEAQMSKVSAISGATAEDMQALTGKAKQLGIDTAFSASQAGEAFQYMAMAGWKTEDMLSGVSGIMDLAAASGEDLGLVSDIVTDALTAFGLKAQDSAHFADVLATASSNSNTNVAMMGETFKYVAPVAGAMGFSIEDTATAIGLMANAGIKGTQAGTALRSVFTRLAKPPKEAAEAMDALRLSITKSDGSFKGLGEIMGELRTKFADLTDEQKTQYAAMLGGQEAMSGLLSIVNAAPEDFEKLTKAIGDADGSAKKMADTMLDNLKGQLTLMGSSLEGLGLAIYDGISDPLKEAVKAGIGFINELSEQFKSGELKPAIESIASALGTLIKTFTSIVATVIPVVVKGLALLCNNLRTVTAVVLAAVAAVKTFQTVNAIVGLVNGFVNAWKGATAALELYTAAVAKNASVTILGASTMSGFQLLVGVLTGKISLATAAQAAWNAVMSANQVGIIIGLVAGLSAALGVLYIALGNQTSQTDIIIEQAKERKQQMEEEKKAYDELRASQVDKATADLAQLANTENLYNELDRLVDANGRVDDANRGRVAFILGELNNAFGTEYQLIDGQIKKYQELKDEIDSLIEKRKYEIVQKAALPMYEKAVTDELKNRMDAADNLMRMEEQRGRVEAAEAEVREARAAVDNATDERTIASFKSVLATREKVLEGEKKALDDYTNAYNASTDLIEQALDDKVKYEQASALASEGNFAEAVSKLSTYTSGYREAMNEAAGDTEKQRQITATYYAQSLTALQQYAEEYKKGTQGYTEEGLKTMIQHANDMYDECKKVGVQVTNGVVDGIDGRSFRITDKIAELTSLIPETFRELLGIHSPSRVMRDEVGEHIAEGVAVGIEEGAPEAEDAAAELSRGVLTAAQAEYERVKKGIDAKRARQDKQKAEADYAEKLKNAKDAAEAEKIKQERIAAVEKEADDARLEAAKQAQDALQKEQKAAFDALKTQLDREAITKKDYYVRLGELRDKYFAKDSEEWQKYSLEITKYQKDVIKETLDDIQKLYDSVLSKQDRLTDKLKSTGELYAKATYTFKGIGKHGEDWTVEETQLRDLSADVEQLKRYRDALLAVKERGVPAGIFEQLRELSVEEGTAFADALLAADDETYQRYLDAWQAKQDIGESIAKTLMADDWQEVNQQAEDKGAEMYAKLKEAFGDVPEDFFQFGQDSVELFGQGFMDKVKTVMDNVRIAVQEAMAAAVPKTVALTGGYAPGGQGYTNNTYNNTTFQFASSGEPIARQIQTAKAAEERNRLRGI